MSSHIRQDQARLTGGYVSILPSSLMIGHRKTRAVTTINWSGRIAMEGLWQLNGFHDDLRIEVQKRDTRAPQGQFPSKSRHGGRASAFRTPQA
jgi:hypothetical protein